MMNSPLVSIVVPTFNTRSFLEELINSVQKQTFSFWELLIVDDISIDGTDEMVSSYSSFDSRIRYFKRDIEPKGAQTCRNIGLKNSTGKYVLFFDSDDLIADFCLDQRIKAMEDDPDLDFAIFPACSFITEIGDSNTLFYGVFIEEDILGLFISRILPFVVWNNIYRRESLTSLDIQWDERLMALQDSDFNISTILNGFRFRFVEGAHIDYYWRTNPNGITSSIKSGKKNDTQVYFFRKLYTRLLNAKLLAKYEKEIFIQLIELLRIFSNSKDEGAGMAVLEILKDNTGRRTYLRLLAVHKLYQIISPKIPFERFILPSVYRHKMRLLAARTKAKNEVLSRSF